MPPRFSLLPATALYALAFAAPSWPWLSGRVTIPWDAKSQFFPQLAFMARSFASGQSPFWTPHVFAGWPQIADPQSLMFSPVHLALARLSPSPSFWAADAAVFAMLFVGGLAVLLIARDRGWHMAGALVAGLAFAFGGSNASRLQHIGQIESVCWLALALFLLLRALDRSSMRWGVCAGIAIGFLAIGRDQVAFLGLGTLSFFVLWHWLDGEGRVTRWRASVAPLALAGVIALTIAAVPVLLTAALASESNRSAIDLGVALRGSLHPANFLTLLFPDLFGAADPAVPYWGPPSFPWHERFGSTDLFHAQNIGQLSMGAFVAVGLIALIGPRGVWADRGVRPVLVAALLLLLYALGRYTPVFSIAFHLVPGIDLFRRPADATFPLGLMLALLGGYGVHRVITDARPASRLALVIALLAVAAVTANSLWLAVIVGSWRDAIAPLASGLLVLLIASSALALARRFDKTQPLLPAALIGLLASADLAINNSPHESNALPPSTYDALRPDTANETVALLRSKLAEAGAPDRRDRVEMIGIGYHWPNLGQVHGFDHLFGQSPVRLRDFTRATDAQDTVAIAEQRTFSALLPSYRSPLENLFGVRWIATGVPVEQIDKTRPAGALPVVARTADATIHENPDALPRVMLFSDWRIANLDTLVQDGRWPDLDPRRIVMLDGAPGFASRQTVQGTAAIQDYRNTLIEVETTSEDPAILVLNDIWHPWWRACVGDRPTRILKANALFRGVEVPAGTSRVRFTFHPFAGLLAHYVLPYPAPRC